MKRLAFKLVDRVKQLAPPSARQRLVAARLAGRQVTAARRALPDLLIIGTQRGGTSSLYKYLGRHPEVAPAVRKEVNFFTNEFDRGSSWYRAHFPMAGTRSRLCFEATPDYMFHPLAAPRAASVVPGAKVIALLRDPADRAFSHYHHMVRLGFETESFVAALDAEAERVAGDLQRALANADHKPRSWLRYSYVGRGRYGEQLEVWRQHFSEDQMMLVRSEDLYADPSAVLHRIQDWLGLRNWVPPEFRNFSYLSGRAEAYGRLPETVRHRIYRELAPDRELLAAAWADGVRWPDG